MPLLSKDVDKQNDGITKAVATIENAMLERGRQKLDYWPYLCRVINSVHIEHLRTFHKKLKTASFQNTGWANKMLPLFNHTQVFKCEFIQNFYSKICEKKH